MSLGLVAYGSSDESEESDNEETNEAPVISAQKHLNDDSTARKSDSPAPVTNPTHGHAHGSSDSAGGQERFEKDGKSEDNVPSVADLIEDDEYDFVPNPQSSRSEESNAPNSDTFPTAGAPQSIFSALKLPPPKKVAESEASELTNGLIPPEVVRDSSKNDTSSVLMGPELKDDVVQGTMPLLKGLPAPQNVKAAGPTIPDDNQLEEEVKPKIYDSAELPKPPAKQKKQPVKITIPSLPDSDDEDDEPKKKKMPAKGKVGLFSLLPAPKNMVVKKMNRPLIPHTLKRPAPAANKPVKPPVKSAPAVKSTKPAESLLPGVPDIESDDEDDGAAGNFFSLGNNSAGSLPAPAPLPPNTDDIRKNQLPFVQTAALSSGKISAMAPRGPWLTETKPTTLFGKSEPPKEKTVSPASSATLADTPLTFKKTHAAAYQYNRSVPPAATSSYQTPDVTHDYMQQEVSYGQMETGVSDYLQDEEFRKIQGKTRRGNEAINIIDVNVDDKIDPTQIVRNVSEEQEMASHSRRRKDLPSSQQRRKHQITYLAFQAKERELELKNQWAQNRQSKQQTQSKYGF